MRMNERTIAKINEWDKFNHLFKRHEFPARTVLLREGDISKNLYRIEKGCLRTWFNNDGNDITTQFFFEGDSVSSLESFKMNQPSLFSIEAIEPCILQSISRKDLQFVMDSSPSIKLDIEEHLFKRLVYCQKLLLSHIKDSPQKRYEEILNQRPDIIMRIPQHYIASYLGITKVHLSRIKSKLIRKE